MLQGLFKAGRLSGRLEEEIITSKNMIIYYVPVFANRQ